MTSGLPHTHPTDEHSRLRAQIKSSLKKVKTQRDQLLRTDKYFSIASLLLGAAATFIAGESALAGEPMIGNWRSTTTIASICTLGATVAAGLQKQIVPTDMIVETSECTAQLKVLTIETIAADFDVDTVTDSYQRLIAEFSRIDI